MPVSVQTYTVGEIVKVLTKTIGGIVSVATDPACCCGITTAVICDSVAASKSKCGWLEFTHPDAPVYHYYLVASLAQTCFSPGGGADSSTATTTIIAPLCHTADETCTGSGHSQGTISPAVGCDGTTGCDIDGENCGTLTCTEDSSTQQTCQRASCVHPFEANSYSEVITLSSEYTTSALKSNVISALPAFDGVYDDSCGATYNLSSDEISFTLTRCKYEITFSPALTAGQVVTWKEHFVPTVGAPSDTNKTYTAAGGETMIGPYLIPDPTSNGTTTVTSIVVT